MDTRARLLFLRTFANFTVSEMRRDIAAYAENLAERAYSPNADLGTLVDCNIRVKSHEDLLRNTWYIQSHAEVGFLPFVIPGLSHA